MRDILEDCNIVEEQVLNKKLLEELGWKFCRELHGDKFVVYTRISVNALFHVIHTEENEDNNLYEVVDLT